MTTPMLDLAAVVARLEKLEQENGKLAQQNRLLRRAGAVGFALLATLFVAGAAYLASRKTVDVEELVLRDRDGRTRAKMWAPPDGPALLLLDRSGALRLSVGLQNETQPSIQFLDPAGSPRMMLYQMGETNGLRFTDATGKVRANLGVAPSVAALEVDGARGRGEFGVSENEASLILRDPKGTLRAALYINQDKAEVHVNDEAGRTIFRKP